MYQIVIVDDEPKICEGLVHIFPWNQMGFEVAGYFTNGKEALDFINTHQHIDVVMTDIQMPIMSGIELSKQLSNSDIIVIFFSAYQDFEYARSAIINHVTDYLLKPMKYDAMTSCFERVKQLLDNKNPQMDTSAPIDNPICITDSVKRYIEENYRTATLSEAAQQVHFSPTYLSGFFKKEVGISFSDYLLKIRMEKALELLSSNDIMLYEIADAVGYLNPKNLSRNFKQYYGMTPQEYRCIKLNASSKDKLL